MTILHLAANRWWTGSADPVIHLVAGLRARGQRVLLGIAPGDRFEEKAREAGLDLVEGLRLDTRFAPMATLMDVARLRRLVTSERVDVIHAHHSHDHWLAWLVASTSPSGRSARASPVVVRTFHARRSIDDRRLARWLHRRTAAVFAVSRQIEARCQEVGIPANRVFWIPGAADLSRFTPEVDPRPIREEFKLGERPVIASVARLAPNRGHELLLEAFRLVIGDIPEARLLLVGKGEARARVEQRVADLGLTEHVIFTGYRDRDLPSVLAAADGFALMAAGSDESCRAALEAMAAGCPVAARRVGALPETVVHGETGFLVDDDRADSVASVLAALCGDRVRARQMGLAGRRRAEELYSSDRSVVTVERVYQMLR